MVSTSHIKVSLLSIPLLSRKLHFQVMSFNNGCVITYWSERANEEKEMTEDRSGTTSTSSSRNRSTVQLLPICPHS